MGNTDERSVGVVLPSIRSDSAIVREMRSIRHALGDSCSVGSLDPLFVHLYSAIERNTPSELLEEAACGPRCAWCCHTRVPATAPEILLLVRGSGSGLPASVIRDIPELADRRRNGWGRPLHESLAPCAVLEDGLCTAHSHRPIACRTTMSLDADQCRRACGNPDEAVIPTAMSSVALRAVYDIALRGALLHAGFSPQRFDLATGLADAIARPGAEAVWLNGEDPFPSALQIHEDDYLDAPVRRALYEAAFG